MKKFFKVVGVIISLMLILLIYNILNHYFPSNVISKIARGTIVVVTPVLIALVIMYLINPLARSLMRKFKMKKKAAIATSMVIFFAVIIALLAFSSIFMVQQGMKLYDQITDPEFIISVENWFDKHNLLGIYKGIIDFLETFDFSSLFKPAGTIVTSVLQGLSAIILAPIFLWHFMISQEVVLEHVNDNIPEGWRKRIIPMLQDSNKVIETYFKSKLLSIVILFFLFAFLYLALGMPIGYVVLFAVIIASLDLIPYLGPTIGSIIPVVYLFSAGGTNIFYVQGWHLSPLLASFIMLAINVVIQYFQGNIVVPLLMGKEMEINSALILVFMLFFGYVLGFWGILLAIPLGGVILVIWKHIKETGILLDHNKIEELEE
ncbi:MAG TPA: AI-2E family transporter [Haploplasma sp.]|nr:AI-2E family transporter [Haploplasma sp.]